MFALSGSAGLIHEVVWGRLLGHLFGVTTLAISTVLAVYMAGLALGSWAMGRWVARLTDTRRAYALLEIGIGVSALVVPLLLDLIAPLYGWLWRRYFLSFTVFLALQVVLAAAILLPPTILMGATLPALADYLAARPGRPSLAPQWLYTANLAGAVLGVVLAGFVLMPTLGIWRTIVAGALVNIGAGVLVLALPRAEGARPLPGAATPPVARTRPLLLAAAFVSGFASIAAQVAWTRTLILIVGSTTYAFSTVLLVNLAALALGSAWVSRTRRDGAVVGSRLAAMHLLMAVALSAAVYSVNRAPFWYLSLFRWWEPRGIVGLVTMNTTAVFAILLLPVLFAGTILPLVIIGAVPPDAERTGRVVGHVYAVNTLGAILGAMLASLVCIPVLGSERTLLALCVVGAVMGVLFAWSRESPRWLALASVPILLAVGLGAVTQPEWEKKPLSFAPYEPSRLPKGEEGLTRPHERLLFFREGRTATIAVTQPGEEGHSLIINGRVNASDLLGDMSIQVMLAQIPLLVAPRTDDILVLGWGSGVTVGSILRGPVHLVTALEIEPAVVEASHFFDAANHQPLRDPRLTVFLGDGRHILHASDATYDAIVSEPSHPWITGVANLFTADFFALGASRLRPDGVFVQWLQGYEISVDTYRTILATFHSVFPEVLAFKSPFADDWILVGSRRPLTLDLRELDRRWAGPGIQAESERVGIRRVEFLLSLLQLGPEGVREISRGVRINTDDNMRIEFRAPLDMVAADTRWGQAIFDSLAPYRRPVETLLADPAALTGDRARLELLITGVAALGLPTEHYKQLLDASPRK